MPRLVHLTPASHSRGILRAGIRGTACSVTQADGASVDVERAVFAMPLSADFSTTYQWLRELRRHHGETMVAVHIVLPSDEPVYVGHYNGEHRALPLGEAIRALLADPLGRQVVVPRSIARREVKGIRELTQRVGWTVTPDASQHLQCVCESCVGRGAPYLMRRVRASVQHYTAQAQGAESPEEAAEAISMVSNAFERAKCRISPDKLLYFVESPHTIVKCRLAWLLGYCKWAEAHPPLTRLLHDPDCDVRAGAVENLVRAGGVRRAYAVVREGSGDLLAPLLETLEFSADTEAVVETLSDIACYASPAIRAHARDIANALLEEHALRPKAAQMLSDLARDLDRPSVQAKNRRAPVPSE